MGMSSVCDEAGDPHLVPVSIASVYSWVQWQCHTPGTAFCDTLPHSSSLLFCDGPCTCGVVVGGNVCVLLKLRAH